MIGLETFTEVAASSIKPSPENDDIYGKINQTDIDLVNLANDIAENGIREPIQVSEDGFIVSGHRRFAASQLAGLDTLPIHRLGIYRSDYNDLEWKRLLRAYNHQRVKPAEVRIKEALLDIDPDIAYRQLIEQRKERDRSAPPSLIVEGVKTRCEISDRKQQFLEACVKVINDLKAYWPVTVRQVHYGLLNMVVLRNSSKGSQRSYYANDSKSYQDACDILARARLLGIVPWEAVADETRPTSGVRFMRDAAQFVDLHTYSFLRGYRRDLLQSQQDHIELIVEKLTVQGIVEPVANEYCMPMTVGRGYCSINPRYEIVQRYKASGKDRLKLLIASDFDPDGEEIAESFVKSIRDDFGIDGVVASKILLRQDQVESMDLPHNGMEAKETSSRYKKFFTRYGEDFVFELEAVPPQEIQRVVKEAIEATIDLVAFNRELHQEKEDARILQAMKSSISEAFSDMLENGFSDEEGAK